jgi:biotin carboxyl carrier protein
VAQGRGVPLRTLGGAVLPAPSTGRVIEVLVELEGVAEPGDVLAVIESEGD